MKSFASLIICMLALSQLALTLKPHQVEKVTISEELMSNHADSWELMRLDSVIEDFDEVIAMHKGKVIYLDLWASWCGPCIVGHKRAIPFKAQYANEDVVFLYISLDESIASWEKAAHRLNLTKDSYLVPDIYSSGLVKDLRVTTIPRYVIYDKNGKLVSKNAPEPGSEKSKKLLDKYLAE